MAYPINYSDEGKREIRDKLENTEKDDLVEMYKEWLALEHARKRLKDPHYMDCDMEDFDANRAHINYMRENGTIGYLVEEVASRAIKFRKCENGNEAWMCPFGCHIIRLE